MMKTRVIGRTGLQASEIGLGTWAFASNAYGTVSPQASLDTIACALDAGINFFDTAPLYGNPEQDGISEIILGQGLRRTDRSRIIISTKFGRNPSLGTDRRCTYFNARRVRESVEESLSRLGTDYVDVLFFHSPFSPDEIQDDVWDALARVQQAGKVRFVGHSISQYKETSEMAATWARERKIDVIQVVLNLLNRETTPLITRLGEQGVGMVMRECLANGFLSGGIRRDTVFDSRNINSSYSRDEIEARVCQVEKLGFLVRKDIRSLPQAALRWVLDQKHTSVVLSGAKTREELTDAIRASMAEPFTFQELETARMIHHRDFSPA